MTKIKLCGLRRAEDIDAANALRPDYVGFVFARVSRRYVTTERAAVLRTRLAPGILAVGVFMNEPPENVAALLTAGVIDLAQLHGGEDADYLARLRERTDRPLIQAFRIRTAEDVRSAERSPAEYILLDAGAGTGTVFDWGLLERVSRPYFLAGGLDAENVSEAVKQLRPYAVDVSTGIETDGVKDPRKMEAFVSAVREKELP
ncbi:MAG: phosphoribosylanthranilate isomerase [Oscillospiraceae bacterium]|nr:phosphoribosylanthranilate isomerase [Oscillospiraceae bacterium]